MISSEGMAARHLATFVRGRCALIVDSALPTQRDELVDGPLKGAAVLEVDASPLTASGGAKLAEFIRSHDVETVIGLGGGSVMDAVKISALVAGEPSLLDFVVRRASRSGLIVLPPTATSRQRSRTILIPTTVGTGAEVSAVACLDTDFGRRLLVSDELSGDVAVLDAAHYSTLPRGLVFEGILEAFLRVAGTMIGSSPSIFDDDGFSLLKRMIHLGNRLTVEDTSELRLQAAKLSMESHTGWALAGRDPYAAKHWYVANELAYVTGARKMTATATIIGPVWDEIEGGANVWGDRGRLSKLGSVMAGADASLARSAAKGIRDLIMRWDIARLERISSQSAIDAAASAIKNWGGALPMLRGIEPTQIHTIFRNAGALQGHRAGRLAHGLRANDVREGREVNT